MSKKEVKFNCKIVKCMYNSEDYKIYATDVDKKEFPNIKHNKYDNVTIYGNVHNLVVSQSYEITAVEQLDKYGFGYDIVNVRMDKPKNEEEVYMFLREILTENQAGVLWQHYPDIIDIVLRGEADTVNLDKLKGIGEKTFETIKTKIVENYCIYDLVIEFGGILTMSMLKKLYDEFKSIPKMKQELRKQPYKSLTKISGVGFIKADSILLELQRLGKINFPFELKSSAQRCAACMEYYLEENQKEGNTKMDLRDLRKQVVRLVPACSSHYVECLKDPDIYYNKDTFEVSLKATHDTETAIAAILFVANLKPKIWDFDWKSYQTSGEYHLTDEQTSALECICNNNIMILNGFAGSGKSATSAMIIKMLEDNNISYTLMAPTGRAAKVLSDYTGKPAATIHRGLGYMPKNRWGYDSECKLPFDVVLVDEFSMTDIFLFLHLCDAIDFSRTKLIVVGDSAQLPSVGPGNLLYDVINSFVIPTVTLNQIIRSSTRLADYHEGEVSEWYEDKIITWDEVLKYLGTKIPGEISYYGDTYVRSNNGFIKKGLENNKDVKRGLYPLAIPMNFTFKINITELAHIYVERGSKDGGAHGTAAPELQIMIEDLINQIESWYPGINRELLLKIASNNV